jgi:predicted phosphate transport protein (TIGR00153 family)
MFRLIPREEKFFEMFEASARNIYRGAYLLKEMMEQYRDPEKQSDAIMEVEHQGDTITHDIIHKLNQTFITPIDREDIYALSSALDDVLDLIESVSDRMVMYKIKEPTETAKRLAVIIFKSAEEIVKGVGLLKALGDVRPYCIEINRLENEADRISRDAVADLFENVRDPIQVLKWKELYEHLEEATDRCEDVANILENIVLKNS